MAMNVWKWAALAAMAGAAMWLAGCGRPSVDVVRAEKQRVLFVYEATVPLEALHSIEVVPRVSGPIITDIPDIGAPVETGQILFQIDASPYERQRDDLMGRAPATVAAPSGDGEAERLLADQIITRAEYNRIVARTRGAGSAAAPATDEALRVAMESVRQAISDCTVYAPITGTVVRNYVAGTREAAAGQPALVIRQDTPVVADVQIPAEMDALLARAKREKTLTVTIGGAGGPWFGELKPQPNTKGDAYTVYKVQADNLNGQLEIGEAYTVRIDSGQDVEGYVIPDSAFVKDDMVAIVNADDLVDVRTVTVASTMGNQRLVIKGLEEGDQVIRKPDRHIEIGTKVRT